MEDVTAVETMSVKDWVITLIITAIPFVGVIMLFVWGFSSGQNQNKANWAKATLIVVLIAVVLSILFSLLFGALIFSGLNSY
ncbi:MAG: hypothetical protein KIT33_08950 [Candidatus Kapabacteria bacterium]|nr:hypothetical protein [Ignavibacteriota bacterium]MCW5885084.1 hypothetical protein [Candidatus Kapabacteria bacterium]